MTDKVYKVSLEIAGNTAMWTRPDSGDSPCSYPCPTRSAVKGIFESILYGEAVIVSPTKVELCSQPHYYSYTTNYCGPDRSHSLFKSGNCYQQHATVLTDVCYRMYADIRANPDRTKRTEKTAAWEKRTTSPGHAYKDIFERRLKRGCSYRVPCLGWSEFLPTYIGPFREETEVCSYLPDIYIPSMLRSVFPEVVYDTDVVIRNGVLVFEDEGERE